MVKPLSRICLTLFLLGLVSCQSTGGGAANGADSGGGAVSSSSSPEAKNHYFGDYREVVNILSSDLARELHVVKALVGENNHGLLRVGVMLTSQSGRSIQIQAQTFYYTESGAPLFQGDKKDQPWLPLDVKAVGPTEYYSQAIAADARKFLIRLRYAPGEKPLSVAVEKARQKNASGSGPSGKPSTALRSSSKR